MQPFAIAPSILSADFARLGEEVDKVLAAGADIVHFDVMDNHYVPNLTIGPMVCSALRKYGITAPIDAHLMVSPVDRIIGDFIEAVEADESMGGRYRRVAANEDGLMVWGKSGKSQFFPFEKLDHVLDGERIFVAMFADQGVTIPKETFIRGDAEQFGTFLKARINKKLRIETKRKKMKAEKAAAEAKQGDKPQETKRKQKKNKKKR